MSVTFSLSNDTIIEITNNILTALNPGNVTVACNYNFERTAYQIDINQTVAKAPLTIKADTITCIYGDTPQFTCSYTGFVNGENASVLGAFPIYACSDAPPTRNVGSYTIMPTNAIASNYSITYQTGLLQIVKRDLLVTPCDTTRIYGNSNPSFTLSYSGFVNGNTTSNISQPSISTTATTASPVGNYLITLSGGSATNYNLILQQGNLEVTKAPLTVTTANEAAILAWKIPRLPILFQDIKTMTINLFLPNYRNFRVLQVNIRLREL